ncbi:MAG: class I SAM-dependent methyltransferase [Acidobacteriota bacterium]
MKRIEPKDLIERLGVEGLCETADRYYADVDLDDEQHFKPFGSISDTPMTLKYLGEVLAGLELGVGMSVLDFGAGTGWISRHLGQMGLRALALDPSTKALELASNFAEQERARPLGIPPEFLEFDGRRVPLSDESVDRVLCFDAFHHVPNPGDIVAELFRVLKDGGIVGMSEPGATHSSSEMSQYEMRSFDVLENDVDVQVLAKTAADVGFSEFWSVPVLDHAIPIRPRTQQLFVRGVPPLKSLWRIFRGLQQSYSNRSVFFFRKGRERPDSRRPLGLSHTLRARAEPGARAGLPVPIALEIDNTGSAHWLSENLRDLGVVKVGIQLVDGPTGAHPDFRRASLPGPVGPGDSAVIETSVLLERSGHYELKIDLVSESVCWFEQLGSAPVTLSLDVAD